MKHERFLVACLVLLLLLTGCRRAVSTPVPTATPTPRPTPTPTPSPADIAERVGQQMLSVTALHFVIELSGKPTYLDYTKVLALKWAEGDLVKPDKVRAKIRVSTLGVLTELGIIGLGDEQYMTNPLNQNWERLPRELGWYFNPALLFDPQNGIASVIRDADWVRVSAATPDDAELFHLQGRMAGTKISPLTFGMVTSGDVMVDLWINRSDNLVRRLEILELNTDPDDPTRWNIEFSAFNQPVDIKAPPVP